MPVIKLTSENQMKDWIKKASYREMLVKWRYGKLRDPIFLGKIGKLFQESMAQKKIEVGEEAAISASEEIGWRGAGITDSLY